MNFSLYSEGLGSLAVRRSAPAGPLSGVEPEVSVEVSRLVETFAADVAAEGLLSRVDAVVPLEHADRGEALAAHGAAVRLLLGVPAHVHLQLAGEAEALPTLLAAVPPLDALARVGGARQRRLQGPHVLDLQHVRAGFSVGAERPSHLRLRFLSPVSLCGAGTGLALSRSRVRVNSQGGR